MIQYRKIEKGFTLVELIVVITILAILGTVAFVSLQGYAQLARNSIRIDDMAKVATLLDNGKVTGKNLFGYTLGGEEIPGIQIGGTGAIFGNDYVSGDINRSALNVKINQFIDPLIGRLYKLGYSSKISGIGEIATTMEDGTEQFARVMGTYTPRQQEGITGTGTLGKKQFILGNISDIGKLKIGDVVIGTGIPVNTTIVNISSDGTSLTLQNSLTSNTNIITLGSNETAGIILGYGTIAEPVINGGAVLPYSLH